mgnify:CR=1 FL=1
MTEAYIYDAVRTPRGKGRKDGALHEVSAARLSAIALNALKDRNNLQGHDTPPKRIPVSLAECKAKNTPHGFYSLNIFFQCRLADFNFDAVKTTIEVRLNAIE